ncbi:MAG: hypothetical protein WCP20_17095 [Desulfuromonadales bacterium]
MNTHIDLAEQTKIAELFAAGKTYFSIGKAINRDPKTVKLALSRPEVQQMVDDQRQELGEMFAQLSRRALEKISDEALEKSSAYQLATIAAIALDKNRLIDGRSTANIAVLLSQHVKHTEINLEDAGTIIEVPGDI